MRHFLPVLRLLVLSLTILFAPLVASAALPQLITYQGYLTGTDGAPVNKTVTLQLSLYDTPNGGVPLWTERQVTAVANGRFLVNLAAVTPFNLPFDQPYYLGVKVDDDQEMSPRQLFTSSPYAVRSSVADRVADGAVGSGALADGAVTAAKLGLGCTTGQVLIRSGAGWGCGSLATGGTGSLTGIIAGAGLTGSLTAGMVALDVDFAGTGSAATAARSDHNHDGVYRKKYGRVAVVAKSGGDYQSPAAALADVATWCGAPSVNNPCLVKVMPGVYDAGTASLNLLDFVDLEGSGESNTTLSAGIDSEGAGVVNGANCTLARLSVNNHGAAGAKHSIAIYNAAAGFGLFQVAAHASGAAGTYAVYNGDSGVLTLESCALDAPGFTIFNGSAATAATFATVFAAGNVGNAGTLACSASRDGKNVFYSQSCPPFKTLSVVDIGPVSGYASPNTLIKARFSNDMNPATLNGSTFTVATADGSPVAGSVQYDAASRTATFTPAAGAFGGGLATVVATITTGVRDASGAKLAAPVSWSFSVGGSIDSKPPAVTIVTPMDKSTAVVALPVISAGFDEPIDRLASLDGVFKLQDASGNPVPGNVRLSGGQLQFVPGGPLSLGVTYTATVSGARDLAGNLQSAPYSWSFTTTPIAAPSGVTVTATATDATVTWQPVPGATGYNLYWSTHPFGSLAGAASPPIGSDSGSGVVGYSQIQGLGSTSLSLSQSGAIAATTASATAASVQPAKVADVTSPYTFTPPASPSPLSSLGVYLSGGGSSSAVGAQFTLTVPDGITVTAVSSSDSGLASFRQSGNQVAVVYLNSYSSHTGTVPLVTVASSGDFTGKSLADFSVGNATFVDYNANAVTGLSLTLVPGGTAGTSYYFAVTAKNGSAESPNSGTVSTTIDPFPPVVIGSTPAGSNVTPPGQIGVTFSEAVDMRSVNSSTYAVTANGAIVEGTYLTGTGNYSGTAYFQPKSPLQQGTSYNITVSGVKDLAGNVLEKPFTSGFTTAVSAPAGLTATAKGLQASLSWQAVSGASSYNIYWSTGYGVTPGSGTKISGVTATSYTHSGLASGTSYNYIVTAVVGGTESLPSNAVTVTIDNVPPMVTSTQPPNNAADVPVTSSIYVNFSKYIDSSTWNGANVVIKNGNGAVVSGVYNYPNFSPSAPLGFGTTYTMTIGTGVKDNSGNNLAAPYSFSFTTMVAGTPSSLTVTAGNLQSNLTWNAAAGATSYNIYWSTSYGVSPQNGSKISGVTGTSYTHTGLTNGTTYYYVVTAVNGSAEGPPSYYASVRIDTLAPTVTSTTPANNATGVPVESGISVNFSKNINSATWNNLNVSLKDSNGAVVSGSYYYGAFHPTQQLAYNTTYTMTVGTGVKDDNGNSLAAPYSFSFTTTPVGTPSGLTATKGNLQATLSWTAAAAATSYNIYWSTSYGVTPQNGTRISGVTGTSYTHTGLTNGTTYYYLVTAVNGAAEGNPSFGASVLIDSVPPAITSTQPANRATNVLVNSWITVNFSKSISYDSWNSSNVTVKDSNGGVVSGNYFGNGIFQPNQPLAFNTTYTVTIGTGVKDNNGNSLSAPYSFSFTTAPVGTPSVLTATRGNLQATLSWTAAAGATGYNIYWATTAGITPQNGIKISGLTGTSYTHTGLANGTTYYYIVTAVNGTAEGSPSPAASVLVDNAPPTILSTSPADKSGNAPVAGSITVTFNKPINSSTWNYGSVALKDASGASVSGSYGFTVTSVSPPAPGQGTSYGYNYASALFTPYSPLAYNTTYTMTVGTAVQDNAGNNLAAPYSFSFATPVPAPSGLAATAGNLQATLSWAPVAGATSYNIYWSNSPGVTKTTGSKIVTGSSATTYSHTGLANGSTYVYRVTAVGASGESDLGNEVRLSFDTTAPVASAQYASYAGLNYLIIDFSEGVDRDSLTADAIQVTNGGAVVPGTLGQNSPTRYYWYGSEPLRFGTTYTVTVKGVKDLAGNVMAPYTWTFTTDQQAVPGVTAAAGAAGSKQNVLTWAAVPGATSYNLYWAAKSGVTPANGTRIVGAVSPFTHSGLTGGATYYYVLTAVSGQVEGIASAEVSAVAP